MKSAKLWILIGATAVGLTWGRAPLCAQPAGDVIATDGDDKPWNQGVPLVTRLAARALFFEGNHLFQIPLFAQAAEKYTAALSQWKQPRIYFNLALAQLNLGQDVEARDSLSHVLEHGAEALDSKDFQEAQRQLRDLDRKLGRIRISCQTDGAEVTLDGATLFTSPGSREVWVKPKAHEITAKRPDYLSEARRVAVAAGEIKTIDLRLITLSEAEEGSRRWSTWKPWAVIVAAGSVAVASGAVHAISASNFHDYDRQFSQLPCARPKGCLKADIPAPLNDQLATATREQQIAAAGYVAAGALVVTGAVLVYLNRPRLTEAPISTPLAGRVTVAPAVSSDMIGILVRLNH